MLEGAIQISQLKKFCLKYSMPAIALTDTNNMFGALEFSETMAKAGVQPIIGLTIAVSVSKTNKGALREPDGMLVLLATSKQGYLNLMQIASKVWLEVDPAAIPCVDLNTVLALSDGLIVLTGGPDGIINKYIVAEQTTAANDILNTLHDSFKDRLYIELQRHGLRHEYEAETFLIEWAYKNNVGLVATQQPFFEYPENHAAHDALLCISEGTYLSVKDRRKVTPRHSFLRSHEMVALFADLPEAIDNTIEIAKRCNYRPHTKDPILPRFTTSGNRNEADELADQARDGLRKLLKKSELFATEKEYFERLEFELDVINQMGFPGYFLIVADFIKWAKEQNIPVGPGRGSGAGSVVAWALTITGLDPIRFGLLFERFLNPERVSMPDFDIDFCQDRRGEVIEYVKQKYGVDRVAQIITFGTLQPRAALRDVGRVMQLPLRQIDRLAKLIPNNPADPVTLKEALLQEPRLRQATEDDDDIASLLRLAMQLEGLIRNASTHAAGVVISDRPLVELTPLYLDPRSDIPATQFNMKWVEKAGLVKFDFLGLKTLTVIDRALGFMRLKGVDVDIDALPLDDKATYEILSEAETIGVFQLESPGMRDTLRKAGPDCFEDIIAIIALYRPGPMDNIPKFVACKFGKEKPIHLHDMITPLVKDTYGVIIYQEQVMQIAQVLSGYSLGEADVLRRAMGKKIKSEMQAQRARFVSGAVENGVEKNRANEIFDIVDKFAGYGFNKSHSAAYALICYQTAWLKKHHTVEFLAASMSLDITNTDKLSVFVQDAKLHKVKVIPPDINTSDADFAVIDGEILYALGAIRNVGVSAMNHLVEVRKAGGKFKDLYDFADRVDPGVVSRRTIENLAKAGAFRSIEPNCRNAVEAASLMQTASASAAQGRKSGQESLFGDEGKGFGRLPLPNMEPWGTEQRLEEELKALGFYLSGHPLDDKLELLAKMHIVCSDQVGKVTISGRTDFRMAGIVRKKHDRVSAKTGKRFSYVLFSDTGGEYEVLVPPEMLDKYGDEFQAGNIRVLHIKAENNMGDIRFRLAGLDSLDNISTALIRGLSVHIENGAVAETIAANMEVLKGSGKQKFGILELVVTMDDGRQVIIDAGSGWPIDHSTQVILRGIPGVQSLCEIENNH
ncbi:DNA polymerase III subunit alpha [Oceanicaulis sp. AH-315-P02]|nr:DNA polymerase III subunit alpha [Oceanicaulis sp. AH-315-P02]